MILKRAKRRHRYSGATLSRRHERGAKPRTVEVCSDAYATPAYLELASEEGSTYREDVSEPVVNEQIVDTIDAVEAVQTAKVENSRVEPKQEGKSREGQGRGESSPRQSQSPRKEKSWPKAAKPKKEKS
jgi:hypothetical protein